MAALLKNQETKRETPKKEKFETIEKAQRKGYPPWTTTNKWIRKNYVTRLLSLYLPFVWHIVGDGKQKLCCCCFDCIIENANWTHVCYLLRLHEKCAWGPNKEIHDESSTDFVIKHQETKKQINFGQ
jgi:hypothetical protein